MANVVVQNTRYTVNTLYQWDLNQVLKIRGLSLPSIPEVHFTNASMDRAIVKQASMNSAGVITVGVPNSLLQKPYKITAYVCIYDGNTFQSLYKIEIPVKARVKPNDYALENDDEIYSFNALENMVRNTLTEVNAKYDQVVAKATRATEIANNASQTANGIEAIAVEAKAIAEEAKTNIDSAKQAATAAKTTADAALPKTGGTMTGTLTLKDIILTQGENYGPELPDPGTTGRLFFKEVVS